MHERERAHFCSRLFSPLRSLSHLPCARFVHEPQGTSRRSHGYLQQATFWLLESAGPPQGPIRLALLPAQVGGRGLGHRCGARSRPRQEPRRCLNSTRKTTFAHAHRLHIKDMAEVGRPLLRSKAMCLEKLKGDLGREKTSALTRERLIAYGKARAKQGAGPVTLGMDIGYIRTDPRPCCRSARRRGADRAGRCWPAWRCAGLASSAKAMNATVDRPKMSSIASSPTTTTIRGRRFPSGGSSSSPSPPRCGRTRSAALLWTDVDLSTCLAIVRNRKDPRRKSGNDQKVPLLDATGYDAVALLKEQRALGLSGDRSWSSRRSVAARSISRTCAASRSG